VPRSWISKTVCRYGGVANNLLNKQSRTADKGLSSSLVVGRWLTAPHHKKTHCYEMLHRASAFAGFCEHGNVLEPEGKRLLGRPWRRWENSIKMNVGK
jgi:hypothetical protein